MGQKEKEDFRQYGSSFQSRVIAALLVDADFTTRIWSILKLNYFDSKPHNWLFKHIFEFYEQYKSMPLLDDLRHYISDIEDQTERFSITETLREIEKVDIAGLKHVKDRALEFCKNHNMRDALLKSVDLWEKGDYKPIPRLLQEALIAGDDNDIGHEYFTDEAISKRLSENHRTPIATGMEHLDVLLRGGLSNGELGVILAGTGLGKTWLLCYIGYSAVLQGKKVIHYTFELADREVGQRYDTMFTGIPINDLIYRQDDVRRILKQIDRQNHLVIREYPPHRATIDDIRLHIDHHLLRRSYKPDMIIVDYADLIRAPRRYEEKRHELEDLYEELRACAKELSVPMWTASQGNRSAMKEDVVGIETIAESWGKAGVADVVITLSRQPEDVIINQARLWLAKSRVGPDHWVVPLEMNISNFKIKTSPPIAENEVGDFKADMQSKYRNGKSRIKGTELQEAFRKAFPDKNIGEENGNQSGAEQDTGSRNKPEGDSGTSSS